jgi:CheY-like chemotaxis protein
VKKILICDDEPDLIEIINLEIKTCLSDYDIEIEVITNSIEALIKVTEFEYDLVITDQRMPTMTGAEFLYNMKNILSSLNKETPVIILSGFLPDVKQALDDNDTAILMSKPYSRVELIKNVKELLEL